VKAVSSKTRLSNVHSNKDYLFSFGHIKLKKIYLFAWKLWPYTYMYCPSPLNSNLSKTIVWSV